MTDDLVAWLRAQLDEDKRVAVAAAEDGARWHTGAPGGLRSAGVWAEDAPHPEFPVVYDEGWPSIEQATHIARHDPARVLREVAAKRAIVKLHSGAHECSTFEDNCTWIDADYNRLYCDTVRLLASAYADRPGFRTEWAPDKEESRG